MTDRVCPSCGKSALSVATRCPRCGYAFEARYDRQIDPRPRRQRIPGGLLIVAAIVAVGAANLLWKSGRVSPHDSAPVPAADSAPRPVPPQPLSHPAVAPVESVVVPRRPAAAATGPVAGPPPQVTLPRAGERRYASTWINVRSFRSSKSRVVRVLRPGEAVQVDSLEQGWYRIVSGEVGYADRRLLSVSPPRPTQ